MAPLIVMLVGWCVLRVAGVWGFEAADSWVGALRYALAAMFLFTGVSHFVPRLRADMVRMVPPNLPAPATLVTLTGLLELAGAIGLLVPGWTKVSAWGLTALLAAMFPANVHAARAGLSVTGRPASPLWWRLPLQLFWIAALAVVAHYST